MNLTSPRSNMPKAIFHSLGLLVLVGTLAGCSSGSSSSDASNQDTASINELTQADTTSTADTTSQFVNDEPFTDTVAGTGNLLPVLFDSQTDLDLEYAQAGVDLVERMSSAFILPADIDVFFIDCGVANAFYVAPFEQSLDSDSDQNTPSENNPDENDSDANSPDQAPESQIVDQLFSSAGGSIVMCHELTQLFANFYTDKDQATGASLFVLMHELGHALVNQLSLPVLGIEESYVDGMAAVFLGEAGMSEGSVLAGWFFGSQANTPFFDTHRAGPQRLGDLACWGVGADPTLLTDPIVNSISLQLMDGGRDCVAEYAQQLAGFNSVLGPHLNVRLQEIF